MITQAVISIVKNDQTFIKIVCGCGGNNAEKLAEVISRLRLENIDDIDIVAIENNFGCKDCLVVMNKEDVIFGEREGFGTLYSETFEDPYFNPRWKCGTADKVIILNF